jgi:hypothetical protein
MSLDLKRTHTEVGPQGQEQITKEEEVFFSVATNTHTYINLKGTYLLRLTANEEEEVEDNNTWRGV